MGQCKGGLSHSGFVAWVTPFLSPMPSNPLLWPSSLFWFLLSLKPAYGERRPTWQSPPQTVKCNWLSQRNDRSSELVVGGYQLTPTSILLGSVDTLVENHMPQVKHLTLEEGTLAQFCLQAFLLQLTQHHFQPLQMLFNSRGEDHNVIQI